MRDELFKTIESEVLVEAECTLGEGVQWNADHQRIWWTDIHGCALWSCDADGHDVARIKTPERLGSFAFDPGNRILGAFASGLFRWDLDSGRLDRLTSFEPGHATSRYNDGRCDRAGRFIAGGMDEDGLRHTSSLTRWDGVMLTTLRHGIGCSNSICFSPEGRWMYFSDTPTRTILRLPYDLETGDVGEAELFCKLGDGFAGFPDGSCVDADGAIWNARFNGASVQQIRPDGSAGISVVVGAPQVTCACFGGADLDRLYITTARENMSEQDIIDAPLSGALFVAEPGVTGLPEDRFARPLF
ncbi:MAG: SMP-30/gluconolactonase/LRE family protein [Pseudomonadota bacterium]